MMTTQKELLELRKKKRDRDKQEKIDKEAKQIKDDLDKNTPKGTFKNIAKRIIKNLME